MHALRAQLPTMAPDRRSAWATDRDLRSDAATARVAAMELGRQQGVASEDIPSFHHPKVEDQRYIRREPGFPLLRCRLLVGQASPPNELIALQFV
jgi:hypothetical protein